MSEVQVAKEIAKRAHAGPVDKSGVAYIGHPERVAHWVARMGGSSRAVAAAWLHDVVEDSPWTLEDLRAAGISGRTCRIVDLMTKKPGQGAEEYFRALRSDSEARLVKMADLADNTSPERLALLDASTRERLMAKYSRSRELLLGAG